MECIDEILLRYEDILHHVLLFAMDGSYVKEMKRLLINLNCYNTYLNFLAY